MVCKPIHHGRTHSHAVGVPTYATEHSAGWTCGSGDARCPSWQVRRIWYLPVWKSLFQLATKLKSAHVLTRRETKRYSTQQSRNHRRRLPWWDQSNSHQPRTNRFYHYERWTNRTNGRRQVWSHESIPGQWTRQDFLWVGGFGSTGA
jgi:hypothetical protein